MNLLNHLSTACVCLLALLCVQAANCVEMEPTDAQRQSAVASPQESLSINYTIDHEFARKAAEIYFNAFPGIGRDVKSSSGFLIVLQREYPGLDQLRYELSRAMPRAREMSFCFFESAKTIEDYHSTSAVQMAVLLARKDLSELSKLAFYQINELQTQVSNTSNIRINSRCVLICMADTFEQQELLLRHILKNAKWPSSIN